MFVSAHWQNMWHGGRAISFRSAGFHADMMMRRSFGFVLSLCTTYNQR